MSFAGAFSAIARRYGRRVELERDGTPLGEGLALLQPLAEGKRQFLPTDLGVRRRERFLCLGERGLPFSPEPGDTVLSQGTQRYDVVNAREVLVGEERVYWRAVLERREEDEA